MSKINELLNDYRDDGVEDSSGAFTIDFQKAREKLAKFQLRDPHEFILKFVQAGNLASDQSSHIDVVLDKVLSLHFHEWEGEWSLERLAERLASASLVAEQDPLTHLAVGISALMGLGVEEIHLIQKRKGETAAKSLMVKKTLEWDSVAHIDPQASFLRITFRSPKEISTGTLKALLESRCAFSAVPIHIEGGRLKVEMPKTSGAHRAQFFRENEVLAKTYRLPKRSQTPPMLSLLPGDKPIFESERLTHLSLTVDLDPQATIWFCKDGVMTESKKLDLGVPGIVGVVSADDVPTDLTGSQFLESQELEQLRDSLVKASQDLLTQAIDATKYIVAHGQPPNSTAPLNVWLCGAGCGLALLGWILSLKVLGYLGPKWVTDWAMTTTLFWIAFPLAWMGLIIWRHGSEKDSQSDGNARKHLLDALYKAQTR